MAARAPSPIYALRAPRIHSRKTRRRARSLSHSRNKPRSHRAQSASPLRTRRVRFYGNKVRKLTNNMLNYPTPARRLYPIKHTPRVYRNNEVHSRNRNWRSRLSASHAAEKGYLQQKEANNDAAEFLAAERERRTLRDYKEPVNNIRRHHTPVAAAVEPNNNYEDFEATEFGRVPQY